MNEDVVMTFGKFKGKLLSEIPLKYLDWLIGEEWFRKYSLYQAVMGFLESDPDWVDGDF